jgi:uncharacterized protein YdcH (DUF465 family)
MNAADIQHIKTVLAHSHDGYRTLSQQHHDLDHRLHELTGKHYLSATEQIEEVVLKKRKLALKDQMERLAREYLATHASAT